MQQYKIDKINSKIDKTDYCHIWRGGVRNGKTPSVEIDGDIINVKHFMLTGESRSQKNKKVVPLCGNVRCVNPKHLKLSSRESNRNGRPKVPQPKHCGKPNDIYKQIQCKICDLKQQRKCVKCNSDFIKSCDSRALCRLCRINFQLRNDVVHFSNEYENFIYG